MEMTTGDAIRLLRELAMLGVLSYLCVRLFSGELSLDFAKLSASELVNLLLAFFSIALSAAFYFAATSQSNQFYDNVNKFSKDTSELLGRVDEQVKGLGGRQTELRDSIDKYYARSRDGASTTQEVEAKAKAVEASQSKMVTEILNKTTLSVSEREKIRDELKANASQLAEFRKQLAQDLANREGRIARYAQRKILRFGVQKAAALPFDEWALQVLQSCVPAYLQDLKKIGYVTDSTIESAEQITPKGRGMLAAALSAATELGKI